MCAFSSELLFPNPPPSCHFLFSDSSALDTQVLSHCLSSTTWTLVISMHVHLFVYMLVNVSFFGIWCDGMCGFCVSLELDLKKDVYLSVSVNVCLFSLDTVRIQHVPYCHFVLVILLFLSFQKMICVSNWTFWSLRRECYTIGKSGLKHQERQNSQSWAHELHWCGIIWSFACGASLPSPCAVLLLPYHLSYPQLTSKCTVFSPSTFCHIYCLCCMYISFVVILLLFCFVFSCVHLSCISCFTLCVSSLCSLAVFWIPKCSACSLEGEWWLTFWSDRFTVTEIWEAVVFCTPRLRHM